MEQPPQKSDFFSRYGITFDRVLWGALAVLAVIVLGSTIFSPPDLTSILPGEQDPSIMSETMEGRVLQVLADEEMVVGDGPSQYVQQVEVEITKGSKKGQRVITEHGGVFAAAESRRVKPGQRVLVEYMVGPMGEQFSISDFVRRPALIGLAFLFVAFTIGIGWWTGVRSLISTAFSVLVIVRFILPRLLVGQNPVTVCIIGSIVLMVPSLYLVYGWKPKTHAAVLGLAICLVITWILAAIFVSWASISGFGGEEGMFLAVAVQSTIDMRGLVLGGIILGTLGVLDDITVGQASAIFELHAASPGLSRLELFKHGMAIGRDHIASMVNTLLLAYVGAALPLFLLLMLYQEPLGFLLNRERLVQEIIRTLVGSLGLMLAVPVTSLIASWMARNERITSEGNVE